MDERFRQAMQREHSGMERHEPERRRGVSATRMQRRDEFAYNLNTPRQPLIRRSPVRFRPPLPTSPKQVWQCEPSQPRRPLHPSSCCRMQHERAHCRAGLPWRQEIRWSAADSGRPTGRDRISLVICAVGSEKRNPAKAGIKFVHFGGILQTAGDRGDRGAV